MPKCFENITLQSLCTTVQGGLEYVRGFNYDSFKNQYDAQHGTPENHLQSIISQSAEQYYIDLLSALANVGISPKQERKNFTSTPNMQGSYTTKQAGSGILAYSSDKLIHIDKIIVGIASIGTYSINVEVTLDGIVTNAVLSKSVPFPSAITFEGDFLGEKIVVTYLQPTPVYPITKSEAFCAPCTGNLPCPKIKDISGATITDWNGGNCISIHVGCECDYACFLSKKIGILAEMRATQALYIEKILKEESLNGQNQSFANYAEQIKVRLDEIRKEIENKLAQQVARISPSIKMSNGDCFSCSFGTSRTYSNI